MLADTQTPVSMYLKLRDKFRNPILLESSDYHGQENSLSYICCEPLADFIVQGNRLRYRFPDGEEGTKILMGKREAVSELERFAAAFQPSANENSFTENGLFGYMSFEAVEHFEDIAFPDKEDERPEIPLMRYHVYRYVIVVDHFRNEMHLLEHCLEGEEDESQLEQLRTLLGNKNIPVYPFELKGEEQSNFSDEEFLKVLEQGRQHCLRGDVFQMVLSRRFQTAFQGDEFNVYRALRSINPSPYLFYFDYGSYKIFGSSPEAQLVISGQMASIYPIAGTFRRTGEDEADAELARKLADDPKENAEHVMLVDLARNDLSRHGEQVEVKTYKEIQFFSHVIHLVSHVQAKLSDQEKALQLVADTFPAGTLSGAPKHRAMQLISRYENTPRGYYGGAIGFLGFGGEYNHAIMIRSFHSQDGQLFYQAGAGVVAKSSPESELQEVHNKLAALRQALETASQLNA